MPSPARPAERAARWRHAPWNAFPAVLGLALGAAVSGLVVWSVMQPQPQSVVRLTVPIPTTDELVTGALPSIALSPDGSTIAYRARRDGELQLFRRALGEAEPTVIPDSANATAPFFSPDGAWIGFDRDGVLMKVAVTGGMPVSICDTGGVSAAASWGDRGEIVFATTTGNGLRRLRAAGGPPTPLTAVDQAHGETLHALPDVLPGGRAAVFTVQGNESATIAAVRFDTGEVTRLTEGQQARYASSGHLLVARGDTIWAARFDPNTLTLASEPVPVLKGLDPAGAAHFALAHNGALAYVPPADQDPVTEDGRPDRVATRRQLLFVQHWDNELTTLVRRSR